MKETVRESWEMACPQCGYDDEIRLVASIWVDLCPDGTSEAEQGGSEHEWDNNSLCMCLGCEYTGTVGAFDINSPDRILKRDLIAQLVEENLKEAT